MSKIITVGNQKGGVPTMVDHGRLVSDSFLEEIQTSFERVCSPIRNRETWKQAAAMGKLVHVLAPTSDAAADATKLNSEIMENIR